MILRRSFLLVAAALPTLASCKKEQRCPNCGMKIDPQSPWRAEIVGEVPRTCDAPRCAFAIWLRFRSKTSIRVQDHYDRAWHDASEVRFVVESDVLGPMGPDLVPVTTDRAAKFTKDHGGRALALESVTDQTLADLK
jgi:nitrous oxide reductase accessory protein NosL